MKEKKLESSIDALAPLKELPKEFIGRGEAKPYYYKQVHRSDFGYIYEVKASNGSTWHEVFKRKEDRRFGKIAYPKSNSFGKTAWSCSTYEKALLRYSKDILPPEAVTNIK